MAERRRMAMLVGNTVEGDSRVEKAAVSAKALGYDVYLVGIKNRTVPQFGSYQSIPIYRPTPDFSEYTAWRKTLNTEMEPAEDFIDRKQQEFNQTLNKWESTLSTLSAEVESVKALPHLLAPERFKAPRHPNRDWEQPISRLSRPIRKQYQRALRATVNIKNASSWRKSAIPGEWKNLWPQIPGFEDAFLRALRVISPDIIHVHDRHPMSAAVRYSEEMRKEGIEVPWVYDAHEFLPGQRFSGPAQHRYGWLNLESEMIQHANVVITVSKDLSDSIASRHHLSSKPLVVENAPLAALTPNTDRNRLSLREELGIPEGAPLAVYVGKLAERRGIYDAVEAAARVPNLHLAFVGSKDSAPRSQILKLGTKFKIRNRLHIVDYVPSSFVTSYISSADIGLSPLFSTPAHEQALATKIREYIVAGLPIVGSDLRAQGRFIREFSIGETHVANDPRSMSEAIERALANLPQLRRNVAKIRHEHTWERQEVSLAKAWETADRSVRERREALKGQPAGVIFSRTQSEKLAPLFKAIASSNQRVALATKSKIVIRDREGSWQMLGSAKGDPDETFSTWSKVISECDVLVATDFEPLFVEAMGAGVNLSRQLSKAGISFFNWTSPLGVLTDSEVSGMSGISIRGTKIDSEKKRAIDIAVQRESTFISEDPLILLAAANSRWLPRPIADATVLRQEPNDAQTLTVLVAPGLRSTEEVEAIEAAKNNYPMLDFVNWDDVDKPQQASIVLDTLDGGAWSTVAEAAFLVGVPVLADYSDRILSKLEVAPPFISTPSDLLSVNLRLALSGKAGEMNTSAYSEYRDGLIRQAFKFD